MQSRSQPSHATLTSLLGEIRPQRLGPIQIVAGRGDGFGDGEVTVVVINVEGKGNTDLLEVGNARRLVRLFLRFGERGQEQRRQNGDDRAQPGNPRHFQNGQGQYAARDFPLPDMTQ